MYQKKSQQKLEIEQILTEVAKFAHSETARALICTFEPCNDFSEVQKLLDETTEAKRFSDFYRIVPECAFDDVTEGLERSKIASVLSLAELLRVMRLLRTSRLCGTALCSVTDETLSGLQSLAKTLYADRRLEEYLDFCILSEEEINDRASDKLFFLRQTIRRTNAEIREKLSQFVRSEEMSAYLQEGLVTMRDNRYVIPVKQEFRNAVAGLIHDQSSSGATVFIEPMAVVDLNNRLRMLQMEERTEIDRILSDLTGRISSIANALEQNQKTLAALDFIFARAKYADQIKGVRPALNQQGRVQLINARHPLIDCQKVVPVSVAFGKEFRLLVISGPNTGGKTVTLKTVGLFVLMVGCGLFLPCSADSEISVFDNIFCDIGDEQSIEQNLSTFSSHITNIAQILSNVTPHSLVLLDEVGAGTEPKEGSALAVSIVEYLLQKGVKGVITTHYGELKAYSMQQHAIENASMEFNAKTLEPTYRLRMGVPGNSNAIDIALKLGIPQEIIQHAKNRLPRDFANYETALREADELQREYREKVERQEQALQELSLQAAAMKKEREALQSEREHLQTNAKIEARQIVHSAQEEAEELLRKLKEMQKNGFSDADIFRARQEINKLDRLVYAESASVPEAEPIDVTKLKSGDWVFVPKLNSNAQITELRGKKATVAIGGMHTVLECKDLSCARNVPDEAKKASAHSVKYDLKTKAAKTEINLLGQTLSEAIANVDAFLDDAVMCGLNEVRVVHGIGTGVLRKGLHEHFKSHPNVASFRLGKYGEGEGGVTVVTLK